jgi:outer membrane usher protein
LNVTGTRENYWHQRGKQDELMISWGASLHDISWSLNWTQRQKRVNRGNTSWVERRKTHEVSFWLTMPLDRWMESYTRATYQMLNGGNRGTQHEIGLNGDSFTHRLNWDVRAQMAPGAAVTDSSSGLLNLAWRGTYGELQGSYSHSQSSRQLSTEIAGGVVIHRHGITLGQPLGQTVVLVEEPGAAGVSAGDLPGVKTDFRGYTTLDFVTPYKANVVTLDPATLPADVEVPQTDTLVIPTAGAVIPAKFASRTGARAVITLIQENKHRVPFGALVTLTGEKTSNTGAGITGDDGEVYMSGLPQKGRLQVSLEDARACIAPYHLPKEKAAAGIYLLSAVCS